jgi:hypothetical protein
MIEGQEAVVFLAAAAAKGSPIGYASKSLVAKSGPVSGFVRHTYTSVCPGWVGTAAVFSSRY